MWTHAWLHACLCVWLRPCACVCSRGVLWVCVCAPGHRLAAVSVSIARVIDAALWRKRTACVPPQLAAVAALDVAGASLPSVPVPPHSVVDALARQAAAVSVLSSSKTEGGGLGSPKPGARPDAWRVHFPTRASPLEVGSWGYAINLPAAACAACDRPVCAPVATHTALGVLLFRCGHVYHDLCCEAHTCTSCDDV